MKRLAFLIASVLVLAACGGGGGGGNSDQAQVKQVWESFFSSSTPVSQKPALIENGSQFKAAINALAKNPLASRTSSKVSKVTIGPMPGGAGAKQANVVYSIFLGSTEVLKNATGIAIQQNGKWVIADQSLCSLLQLEGGKLPSACNK